MTELRAALKRLYDAGDAYQPRYAHDWRCEYRTAEVGWREGDPPIIRCECGYDEFVAALMAADDALDPPDPLASPSTPEPSGLRAKVEGLPSPDPTFPSGYYTADMVSRAAVLALLDGAAPSTEPALDSERCAECSRTIKHSFTCPRVLREVNRLREASAT